MTTFLKFLYGDDKLINQRERKNASDHNPIRGRRERCKTTKPFVYNTSHSFSVRTNRDKYQTPGELYIGDNLEDFITENAADSSVCPNVQKEEYTREENGFSLTRKCRR